MSQFINLEAVTIGSDYLRFDFSTDLALNIHRFTQLYLKPFNSHR